MTAHSLPREASFYISTAFSTAGGPASWVDDGTYFYVTAIDTTGMVRKAVDNENNRLDLRDFHDQILTEKSGATASFAVYLHSKPTHAAEAAAATTFHLSTLVQAVLGGEDLGYGIGIASDEAEATTEIQIDADPGYVLGDALYLYDTSGTVGEFYFAQSVDAGPPVTVTLDRAKHFTSAVDGSDRVYSVIDCWIDTTVTTDRTSASHKTLWLRDQGQGSEDVRTAMGCKPALGQITIAPGVPMQLPFDLLVTDHSHETDTKADFSGETAVGEKGITPGIGVATLVKIAAVGSPLATVTSIGSISITPGVTYGPVPGPNGWNGVHGYIDQGEHTTVELMVPFAKSYATAFNAQTHYHMLIQIGTGTDAVGFYFPNLAWGANPPREEGSNETVAKLSLRALKGSAATGSTADARKANSNMHILFVA